MKISNSKKELAKIISENGGWKSDMCFAAQDACGTVNIYECKPMFSAGTKGFGHGGGWCTASVKGKKITNWHQAILSREEYFHLYPAPDSDGWIEWDGGECPVGVDVAVCVKFRNGVCNTTGTSASDLYWKHDKCISDIIAYRLHKPEQVKPELCESVMRSIPEPNDKPTIEQLAADYRSAKDYSQRKQQEADDAKADAEARLAELVAAGKAIGLVLNVACAEPELVITDWRDLMIGDVIEYVDGDIKDKIGMSGPIVEFAPDATDGMHVRLKCDNGPHKGRLGWPREWRFIRRPAK